MTNYERSVPTGYTLYAWGDVEIYWVRAGRDAFIRFNGNSAEARTTIGAFYRGELRAVESSYADVVGTRYSGFWDFSDPANEHHVPRGGWMNCVAECDTDWFCLHSAGEFKRVSMEPFDGSVPFIAEGVTFHFGR